MSVELEVPVIYGVASTLKILKNLDENLYKQARKDMYTDIKPLMEQIKRNIPQTAPLSTSGNPMSGFMHNGRTGWGNPVVIQRQIITRKKQGKQPLLKVTVKNQNKGGAISIADMAGRGSSGKTRSGKALIRNLSQKPSRYVWPAVMKNKSLIERSLLDTIKKYSNEVNQEMTLIGKGSA